MLELVIYISSATQKMTMNQQIYNFRISQKMLVSSIKLCLFYHVHKQNNVIFTEKIGLKAFILNDKSANISPPQAKFLKAPPSPLY